MGTWTIGNVSLSAEEFRAKYASVYRNTMPDWEREIAEFLDEWNNELPYINMHTSGSTGEAKDIKLSKELMRESAERTLKLFNLQEGDHILLCLPVRYVAGKMMIVRALEGGLNLHASPPTSTPLRNVQGKFRFAAMIPLQVIQTLKDDAKDLSRIEHLIIGGAALPAEVQLKLSELKGNFYETYGMTETATHVAIRKVSKNPEQAFEALPGIRFSINEEECLKISFEGKSTFELQTRDSVKLIDDQHFIWLGRVDHIINSGGIKLHPEILENKLSGILNQRFYLVGVADKLLGQKLVLIVEGLTPDKTELNILKSQIEKRLDKYEVPKEIHFVKRFFETPNHKIKRKWPLD